MDFELLFGYAISIAVATIGGAFILIFVFAAARFLGFIEKCLEELMASVKKSSHPTVYYSAWLAIFFLIGYVVFNLE